MTGYSSGYAFINEAWCTDDLSSKIKRDSKKKKPVQDAVCDLFNNTLSYDDNTDLVKFANSYYDKTNYQRTMKTLPLSYEEDEREISPKQVVITENQSKYDICDQCHELYQTRYEPCKLNTKKYFRSLKGIPGAKH